MNQKEPKRINATYNQQQPHSRSIFPYHLYHQVGFDNPFINGRGFIYLGISKMSFIFLAFTRAHGINKVYQ